MYIAICDDQPEELQQIVDLLQVWQQEHQTMCRFKTFHTADELLDAAKEEAFTLYILDVIMPGTNGIDVAQEIRSFDSAADIVFLTVSPHFAYESYRVKALDYLLKPLQPQVLFSILNNVAQKEQKPQEGFTLKIGTTLVRILFSQLAYVEVCHKHLYFNLTNGQVWEVFGSLKDYETILLERPEFMQTHRSYIVNMLQIAEFSPAGIRTFSGKLLPVSRLRYAQLQNDYMELLFPSNLQNKEGT